MHVTKLADVVGGAKNNRPLYCTGGGICYRAQSEL